MAKDSELITALVLNFNGKKFIGKCLDSLLATDYPALKTVVIDNGSTDGSIEFVRSNYPTVEVLRNDHNYGYACAYNRVIGQINTEYIVLLNNDVEVTPSWLRILMSYAESDDVAAVAPKMKFFGNRKRINSAGGNCDLYGVGWNRGNGEVDSGQYDVVQEVFYGNGGALLIKKRVWREIGPFDERYFLYGEDLDWCWRAKLKGYKIIYVPYSEVHHHWHGSGGAMVNFLERHWLSTVLKNYSVRTLMFIMPRFLALKSLKAIWLMAYGGTLQKLAVLSGILWNLRNFRRTWEKRTQIQKSRRVADSEIQKHMVKGNFELFLWLNKLRHPILNHYRRT